MLSAHKNLTQSFYVTIELSSAVVYKQAVIEEVHGEIDTSLIYGSNKIVTNRTE